MQLEAARLFLELKKQPSNLNSTVGDSLGHNELVTLYLQFNSLLSHLTRFCWCNNKSACLHYIYNVTISLS